MYSKCQKCGKKLTDPESIKRGYGPECWNSLTAHYYRSPVDWENYRVTGQMNIVLPWSDSFLQEYKSGFLKRSREGQHGQNTL